MSFIFLIYLNFFFKKKYKIIINKEVTENFFKKKYFLKLMK